MCAKLRFHRALWDCGEVGPEGLELRGCVPASNCWAGGMSLVGLTQFLWSPASSTIGVITPSIPTSQSIFSTCIRWLVWGQTQDTRLILSKQVKFCWGEGLIQILGGERLLLLELSVLSCTEAQSSQDSSLLLFGNNIPDGGASREGSSTEREKKRERKMKAP